MFTSRTFRVLLLVTLAAWTPLAFAGDVSITVTTSVQNDGKDLFVTVNGSSGCLVPGEIWGHFDDDPDSLWGGIGTYGYGIQCWRKGGHTVSVTVHGGTRQPNGGCMPDSATATAGFQVARSGTISATVEDVGWMSGQARALVHHENHGIDASTAFQRFDLPPTDKLPGRIGGPTNLADPALIGIYVGDYDTVEVSSWGCGEMLAEAVMVAPQKDTQCGPECRSCCGKPIKVTTGNMRAVEHDPLPGGGLQRTYDSMRYQQTRWFGNGWSSPLDAYFFNYTDIDGTHLQTVGTTGADRYIFRDFVQLFPPGPQPATLRYDSGADLYAFREYGSDTVTYFHATDGTIAKTRSLSTGRETLYTFTSGAPARVADSWGNWAWTITMSGGRVASIAADGTPIVWNYTYDGNGNLVTVDVGGNVWRTNTYSGNLLTQITDAAGNLVEAHTYSGPWALSSTGGGSDDVQNVDYQMGTGSAYPLWGTMVPEDITIVTWQAGGTTTYHSRYVAGRRQLVQIDGGCVSCGARNATWTYDEAGHPIREQDGRGYVTTTLWDSNHRVASKSGPYKPSGCDPETDPAHCRVNTDGLALMTLLPTSATKSTAYTYGDANWSDRPTSIITDSVLAPGQPVVETLAYDPVTGTVTTHSTTGYTGSPAAAHQRTTTTAPYNGSEGAAFDPGSVFSPGWLSLPQPAGLRKSVDGPRTDVSDVTSWVYYPIDASVPALLRGHIAATRNAAGHVTQFASYDVFGNATRVVDPNGVATESTYDSLGRLLTSTLKGVAGCDTTADPLCATDVTTTRIYTPLAGPLATEQRPNGGVTVYTYDNRGRTATISRGPSASSLVERITYSYDPASGNRSSEVTATFENGSWVTKRSESYTYNSDALLSSVVHPDSSNVTYAYGPDGILASVKDENHTSPNTSYTYDPAARLASVLQTLSTAAGGQITTRYAYDVQGHLTSVTDPNGNITTYVYDDFGQMLQQNSPVSGTTTYAYDDAGNLVSTTDANNATTTRTYDALNRVTSASSTGPSGTELVTTTYDDSTAGSFGIGRVASMSDPTGSTTCAYERRGLLRREMKTIQGSAHTTLLGYDADGNRSSMTYPSGMVVSYTFDFAGRPASAVAGSTTIVSSAAYLPFGPMKQLSFGNGTTKTTTYDQRYRPADITLNGPSGPLAHSTYAEDNAGNITQIHDAMDPTYNRDFGYDDLNRLTTANSGISLWGSGSYTYDAMGNMLSSSLGTSRTTSSTYLGTTPKLTSVVENGVTRPVTYDPAGNETAAGTVAYGYSSRNQLLAADTRSYMYDGRGVATIGAAPFAVASVAVTPFILVGGASATGTVTLTMPAAASTVVALSSNSPSVSVPPTIMIGAGSSAATFNVTTSIGTSEVIAQITATLAGIQQSATLRVEPAELTTLTLDTTSLANQSQAIGTLTLSGAAPPNFVVTLACTVPEVAVPASVTVPSGASSATFTATCAKISDVTQSGTLTATHGSATRQLAITALAPASTGLSVWPSGLTGGGSVAESVGIDAPAPPTGSTFSLTTTDCTLLGVPTTLTIPPGSRSAGQTFPSAPVNTTKTVTLSATRNGDTRSAVVSLYPPWGPTVASLDVSPTTVGSTQDATGTVLMNGVGPLDVDLSSDPATILVPPFVHIPANSQTATFPIHTAVTMTTATRNVIAEYNAGAAIARLTVGGIPTPYISALLLSPSVLIGGTSVTGTVQMSAAVTQNGGMSIPLSSDNSGIASVPSSVTVKKGSTSQTFTVRTTRPAVSTAVTITAGASGNHQAVLDVLASGVCPTTLTLMPAQITAGDPVTATVTLSGPAPAGGAVVTLGGSRSGYMAVPASVTVPANATSASFAITTTLFTGYTSHGTVVTATYGGITASATLTVTPRSYCAVDRPEPVLCASISIEPCVQDVVSDLPETIGGTSISSDPSLYYLYTPELQLLAETEHSMSPAKNIAYQYVWFGGAPVAQIDTAANATRWYVTDHLGTPLVQTDTAGTVIWRAEYTPYGEVYGLRAGAALHQPLRLPGQFAENGSDLANNVFRWYRGGWGRYTQADPRGIEPDPNLYGYVGNNPVTRTDPFGLDYRRCRLLKETIMQTQLVSDLPELEWLAGTDYDVWIATKWKCKWRCYCLDSSKSCPNIPCKRRNCSLDHGVEEISTTVGVPAAPCKTTYSSVISRGKCEDD